jgi:cysteine desulfurase/selenocysteine lyase
MSKNGKAITDLIGDPVFKKIRKQFPIFQQKRKIIMEPRSKPGTTKVVFFDSASTAQMPQPVLDAMIEYYTTYKSNVGRGIYDIAERATKAYEDVRQKVADFINASKKEIIFTCGTTESINLVAHSFAAHLKKGDEIVLSAVEHHSNFVPWQQVALKNKLKLKIVPLDDQGCMDISAFKKILSKKTKLVSVVHSSNVTGAINDVALITKLAHQVGAQVFIDAAQSVAHQKIDISKIKCDFLAFSGHKLFGPTGVGVLYAKSSVLPLLEVEKFGGGMVFSVSETKMTIKQAPHCFEPGTPNVAGVIGLGAAIDFVEKNINFKKLIQHETALTQMLYQGLKEMKNIQVLSAVPSDHAHLLTFYSKNHHAHDIAAYLNEHGICVRAGHHCVQMFHDAQGINASVRVSFSMYNTQEEVEYFLKVVKGLFS